MDSNLKENARSLGATPPQTDLGRPVRTAVMNNPRSGNNRRSDRLASICRLLDRSGVRHVEGESLDQIVALTRELVDDGTEFIIVNGGDGTVQAVLTALFRFPASRAAPLLAVLPGGSANSTARNVGYAPRPEDALVDLVDQAGCGRFRGRVEERPVLRVDAGGENAPWFAMFFGAGAVYNGIRFAKDQVETRGMRGQLGAGVALAVFLGRVASGHAGKLFPPLEARVAIDGDWGPPERLLGILISTMDQQFFGLRPYWGSGPGPIHYSSLAYGPRHLLRAAVPVMRGRPNRFVRPEFGYRSYNAERIEISMDGGFTLDGELFDLERSTPIRIAAERSAFFLRREPG